MCLDRGMSLLSALLVNVFYQLVVLVLLFPFGALTLLVGCQARRQACKKILGVDLLVVTV